MSGFLFDKIVFGPINSRRFGLSLGVNLLPLDYKYCTFNCVYCECGWAHKVVSEKIRLPERKDIKAALEKKLHLLLEKNIPPDNITFAGNGEPTLHPGFSGIIEDTIDVRDKLSKESKITVLSNSSMLHRQDVFEALLKVDNNVLKLDTALEKSFHLINQPVPSVKPEAIMNKLKAFNGQLIIQTLFLRGFINSQRINNTRPEELHAWIDQLKKINPKYVMIYPIARATPLEGLEKIPLIELERIADLARSAGLEVRVFS